MNCPELTGEFPLLAGSQFTTRKRSIRPDQVKNLGLVLSHGLRAVVLTTAEPCTYAPYVKL